ncbi:aminoacyl-histidine dipeptidase [Fusibacter ferrireducens]|uniref:Aminoacyl-histidine dipeptidase n=1 Tax=Fusibacter ferrireducens TaxID=2785058 RepID=A0ABR9ZR24_9FIRM|nr:aminoacyl-histidine dipeptidase [Fusibacter ferrireducens]MBF4692903.1 aminoacyl-histidine dipeptidase [Fusibacter ferrireducens]
MENVLNGLQPESVFKNFEALTRIPRESGNEAAVADYLVSFAKNLDLEVIREDSNNVIIKKSATAGYEHAPTVILQGHTDMVCVKLDELEFDFNSEPIPLVLEGDFIKTKGTTLGADNGIAVAMMMSILESKTLAHPALVALFTVSEETGMDGVVSLNPENVKGDILINIDSEEEGTLLASCAGGANNIIEYPFEVQKTTLDEGFKLVIQGLNGGHSGIEINKNRANAIKLMGRVLKSFEKHFKFEIAKISGGEKMNAIAKRAEMTFVVKRSDVEILEQLVPLLQEMFVNEFSATDGGIKLVLTEVDDIPKTVMTEASAKDIANIIRLIPFGVQTMSGGIEGLVESSSNLGVLEQTASTLKFTNAVRSSVKSLKSEINERFEIISEMTHSKNYIESDYPEWQFKLESPIRELMKTVYAEMFNKELKVDAIHAGLECGFLREKVGDIDMISLGPNLFDVHTPFEKLSISSTRRVYEFLCEVLKRLK